LNIIFDNEPYYDSSAWYIDLEENKKKNKTHDVYFESYVSKSIVSGGSKRHTIKNRKNINYKCHIFPNYNEIVSWDYDTFIKK
jgi:hypothetical protein